MIPVGLCLLSTTPLISALFYSQVGTSIMAVRRGAYSPTCSSPYSHLRNVPSSSEVGTITWVGDVCQRIWPRSLSCVYLHTLAATTVWPSKSRGATRINQRTRRRTKKMWIRKINKVQRGAKYPCG